MLRDGPTTIRFVVPFEDVNKVLAQTGDQATNRGIFGKQNEATM